jgi:hypothetical protein
LVAKFVTTNWQEKSPQKHLSSAASAARASASLAMHCDDTLPFRNGIQQGLAAILRAKRAMPNAALC